MCGGGGHLAAPGGYGVSVGEKFTGVLEEDDPVAQKAPPLLRVTGHDNRGLAVVRGAFRAPRFVRAHLLPPVRPAVGTLDLQHSVMRDRLPR
jgi:hypothetical protein